jgi:hypothetical protein
MEDLYVIWAGANDFANASSLPVPADLVQNIHDHITTIARAVPPDAKLKFLVANLPRLGQTARAQWLGQYYPMISLVLDGLSTQFNALLDGRASRCLFARCGRSAKRRRIRLLR